MGGEQDPDELLMAEVRAFFAEVDPVPPLVSETAKASLGWRRLDADLAELLSDSALEEQAFALARSGEATARAVTFSSGDLTIDIEVHVTTRAARCWASSRRRLPPGSRSIPWCRRRS